MKIVTSLTREIWNQYGHKTLPTFRRLPGQVVVYLEEPPWDGLPKEFEYINLLDDTKLPEFRQSILNLPIAHGLIRGQYNYHYDARKFSPKVFAQAHAAMNYGGMMFWIDADVTIDKEVPKSFMEGLLSGVYTCFLGREQMGYPHSECGFIGFDCRREINETFMNAYAGFYEDGMFLMLQGWHDCYVYDAVMRTLQVDAMNLSAAVTDDINVWPQTALGEYMTHYKGGRKQNVINESKPKIQSV